ncbi:hypothetical protein D5086_017002 [Populus alba]|uniref:Uncharacterized protein n=1 Tax=Populus alba TaxID=43335 RepID=A0ACC4BW54_POPAL
MVLLAVQLCNISEKRLDPRNQSSANLVAAKVRVGSSPDEILLSWALDKVSNSLVDKLLFRFKDDRKSALGVFRWARLRSGYKHRPKAYDMMVDNLINLTLDSPRDEQGYARHPCVISYSTFILFYCRHYNFYKVYELLDEMEAQGCPPYAVTTTTTVFLAMSQNFEEALQRAQRMKSAECKPDMTSTYNSMIALLCHDGQVSKALALLKEMETLARFKLDGQAFYPLLKACFRMGDMNLLIQLMDDTVKRHQLSLDRSVYALLIHGLCRANKC